ncbi:MAG: TfoX/Sxy family protein, partial [Pseudomonadota bacterium]
MDDAFLRDLFASVGPISIKRMFGGQGIYVDGVIIAAVQADRLMVKGDDLCSIQYEAVGMKRWAYKNPKTDKAS